MSTPEIHRTERDGIPVLWIEDERTPRASLVFRAGRLDESPVEIGAHHLLEHLVLASLEAAGYDVGGVTTSLTTEFSAIGDPGQLRDFIADVCNALTELPGERLEAERQILQIEQTERLASTSLHEPMLPLRWGATPLGRLGHPELGLDVLGLADLRRLAADQFHRGTLTLCWAGNEPPHDLRIPLGAGPCSTLPPNVDTPITLLPAAVQAEPDDPFGMAISAVVPDDASHLIACDILRDRIERRLRGEHAAVYSVELAWDNLLPDLAHVSWVAALDPMAAASASQDVIDELLSDWPIDELRGQLDRARRRVTDELATVEGRSAALHEEARRVASGAAIRTLEQRRATLAALDVAAIERAQRTLRATALVLVPPTASLPGPPFQEPNADTTIDRTGAVTFTGKGLLPRRRDRLTISADGIELAIPGAGVIAMRWRDLVSAVRTIDGQWELTSRLGTWMYVAPILFKAPTAVDEALVAHVPATVRHPAPGERQLKRIEARAQDDLTERERRRTELDARGLAMAMTPDEQVLRVIEGSRGIKSGMIAVTEDRILHAFAGALTTDIPHRDVRELLISHSMSGVRLTIRAPHDEASFDGGLRSAEFVALRDLLEQRRTGARA